MGKYKNVTPGRNRDVFITFCVCSNAFPGHSHVDQEILIDGLIFRKMAVQTTYWIIETAFSKKPREKTKNFSTACACKKAKQVQAYFLTLISFEIVAWMNAQQTVFQDSYFTTSFNIISKDKWQMKELS